MACSDTPSTPGAPRLARTPRPRREEHVGTVEAVIEGVEPKPRVLLRLATEFPAQQRDAFWQVSPGHKALSLPVRNGATVAQAALPSLLKTCVKSGPFAPRALPRFLATMSRSDSRPRPPRGYGFHAALHPHGAPRRVSQDPHSFCRHAPSPLTPDSLMRMRSLLPHQLQASSSSEDWPLPLVSRGRIGFAYAGLASWLSQLVSHSPGLRRTDPFRTAGYPSVPGRSYMVNEQFHG